MIGRFLLSGYVTCCMAAFALAADPPVSLELATEQGFELGGHQQWNEFLQGFGFAGLRIRGARLGDEPKVENRGTEDAPRYHVVGILTGGNQLQLPGASVRLGDRKQVAEWLAKLRGGGSEGVTAPRGAFGMTERQLRALNDALKSPVAFDTRDQRISDVVEKLRGALAVPVEIEAGAASALAGSEKVLDELSGLGSGTALAAAVRPLGLVVVPAASGPSSVRVRIAPSTGKEEVWPIGFKPQAAPNDVAPGLFRFANSVTIGERPLSEAIAAVQGRVQLPVLFDHNALAKHGVDLNQPVSLSLKKTFYSKILTELLFPRMLRHDLKVDEAGRPFLWITTVKQ